MKVIMEKLWFDRYGFTKSQCFLFSDFKKANREMREDWKLEFDERDDSVEEAHSQLDIDFYWQRQASPFEGDTEAVINFMDDSGRIEWKLWEVEEE